MATLDEITKEKQRVSEALLRIEAQREKLAGELAELEATERVLARYSKGFGGEEDGFSQEFDEGGNGCFNASRRTPARYNYEINRRKSQFAVPQRSGTCPCNWQDPA